VGLKERKTPSGGPEKEKPLWRWEEKERKEKGKETNTNEEHRPTVKTGKKEKWPLVST